MEQAILGVGVVSPAVPRYHLNGKVALVTGGARGIGFETARAIHARGGSVVLADVDADAVMAAAGRLGDRAAGVGADVRDAAQVEAAVAAAVERFGGLDVAVANAGIAPRELDTIRQTDGEQWERILDVNLLGVWRTTRAALPQVVERRGQIVVVASIYSAFNGALMSAYATAKAGVESFGRALRAELSPLGASATVAYFGFIDTQLVRDAFEVENSVAARIMETLPRPIARRLHPSAAGEAIARGLEQRSARVVAPGWWRAYFALRGLLNPLLDRRLERDTELQALIGDADRERVPGGPPPVA
jgi:NAD(P)-dependent dehydrogenase (short-subunit alcohol dehydrogenase family)